VSLGAARQFRVGLFFRASGIGRRDGFAEVVTGYNPNQRLGFNETGVASDAGKGCGVMVDVGNQAPGFSLRGASGAEVSLDSLRGQKRALLVFYPKDSTTG
jgi:hypothetical protein